MAFLTFLKFFRQNVKKFSCMESPLKNINFPEGYEDLAHEKHVLVAGWFRKVTNKRHRSVLRYLLVTKLDIFLFRETLFRKKLQLSVTFSWWDVKEIIYGKDQSTTFVFGQGQRLQIATTGPRYFQHFYKFLTSVLVPEEYPVWWGLKHTSTDLVDFNRGGYLSGYLAENRDILICPNESMLVKFEGKSGGSYGYNANGLGGRGYLGASPGEKSSTPEELYGLPVRTGMVASHSSLIMFGDTIEAGGMRKGTELNAIDRIYGPDSYTYLHFRHN